MCKQSPLPLELFQLRLRVSSFGEQLWAGSGERHQHGLLSRINAYLLRWIRRKYERLRPFTKAKACWRRVTGPVPSSVRALAVDPQRLVTRVTRAG